MAELEIHHEGGHGHDPAGQRVGVQAALLAVALAIVTILSHRAHTGGVIGKSEENDAWNYYQATKLKGHNAEVGRDILQTLAPRGDSAEKVIERYKKEVEHYEEKAKDLEKEARAKKEEVEIIEKRAARYDLGEGLLEIGLVLTSLFFISKKAFFPVLGLVAGLEGAGIAVWGLML